MIEKKKSEKKEMALYNSLIQVKLVSITLGFLPIWEYCYSFTKTCRIETNRLPDISPVKMGLFGISRQFQLEVCKHGKPSPHTAREGEHFYREEKTCWKSFSLAESSPKKKESEDLPDGRGVRYGDHFPPHKYIKNTSTCGTTPTEHLLNAGRRP